MCPFGRLLCSYFPLVKGEQEDRGAGLGPRKTPKRSSFLLPPHRPPTLSCVPRTAGILPSTYFSFSLNTNVSSATLVNLSIMRP